MKKRLFSTLIALLLIISTLAFCLASCNDVTVINLDVEDGEDDEETKKKKETKDSKESDEGSDSQSGEEIFSENKNTGVGLVVDPNSGDNTEASDVEQGIAIPGYGEITIPPNQTENIIVDFYNPEANAGKYYLTFKFYLTNEDGSEDVLYESQLIPPGQHIQSITINHALEEGEYEARLHVQPYKMDGSLAATNSTTGTLKLVVKDIVPEAEQGIAIPGWGEMTMPPNQTENIVVDFYNPEANAGKYYLTFELYLTNEDGSKDVLYESQLIPPGKHIQSITLNHALEEGEYDATMHVQPYKMDGSLAATKNLDAKLKLIVK